MPAPIEDTPKKCRICHQELPAFHYVISATRCSLDCASCRLSVLAREIIISADAQDLSDTHRTDVDGHSIMSLIINYANTTVRRWKQYALSAKVVVPPGSHQIMIEQLQTYIAEKHPEIAPEKDEPKPSEAGEPEQTNDQTMIEKSSESATQEDQTPVAQMVQTDNNPCETHLEYIRDCLLWAKNRISIDDYTHLERRMVIPNLKAQVDIIVDYTDLLERAAPRPRH